MVTRGWCVSWSTIWNSKKPLLIRDTLNSCTQLKPLPTRSSDIAVNLDLRISSATAVTSVSMCHTKGRVFSNADAYFMCGLLFEKQNLYNTALKYYEK
jgi:hypothetical protein